MDAYDIANKIQKYWAAIYPKSSGEIVKEKRIIKVVVMTNEGLREVIGVHIENDNIRLELDRE